MTNFIKTLNQTVKSLATPMPRKQSGLERLARPLGALKDDIRGTAAIEFAFIAPIMIITYFGLASVSLLVSADRSVSHTASVTADLVTQVETIDRDGIEEIFDAALLVMGKSFNDETDFSIDVTSFSKTGTTINTVGYASLGSGFPAQYSLPASISDNLLNETSGLVVTRVRYNHRMLEQFYNGSSAGGGSELTSQDPYSVQLNEIFMLKPRRSATIPFSGTYECELENDLTAPKADC